MKRHAHRICALLLAGLLLAVQAGASAEETQEEPCYVFDCTIEEFDDSLQAIFDAMGASYTMGEEPNIPGAYEYHLPYNVYAKTLTYEGNIEYVLVFLPMEYSADQGALWQYAALMAACVGDIPAGNWAVLLMEATYLTLDTQEADLLAFALGNVMMICETDPEGGFLYAIIEREEYERNEPMDGSFQTG
ncbi:MAG: hypothetical protein JW811_01950 [Clostridiales bacterium]|nr:hypothetical protein [Clostridiales bacterium]